MTAPLPQVRPPQVRRFDEVQVDDELATTTYPIQRVDLVRYAGASGDFNPIHWDPSFAASVGLPDVIAHGMLTMATAVRLVTDWCGDPGAVVEYGVRFIRPVVVPDSGGTSIQVSGRVSARDETARTVTVQLTATTSPAGEDLHDPTGGGGAPQKVLGKAQAVVRLR